MLISSKVVQKCHFEMGITEYKMKLKDNDQAKLNANLKKMK